MMILDVRGQCQEHDPPHVVELNTDRAGRDFPELPCDGTVIAWDVEGECDCGEDVSGEYFPEECLTLPDHECDEDEDEDEEW